MASTASLEQGDGARGDWQSAHFGQFVEILDEYRSCATKSGLRPGAPGAVRDRPVRDRPVGRARRGDPADRRRGDRAAPISSTSAYEILLQAVERYFAHTEETDAQLATLAEAALALMLRVLKPLGSAITTLPVGPEHPLAAHFGEWGAVSRFGRPEERTPGPPPDQAAEAKLEQPGSDEPISFDKQIKPLFREAATNSR